MKKVLLASNAELVKIEEALTTKNTPTQSEDRKLLNARQAADALNMSVTSIWRYVKAGLLDTVTMRNGRRRITSVSVTRLATGGKALATVEVVA